MKIDIFTTRTVGKLYVGISWGLYGHKHLGVHLLPSKSAEAIGYRDWGWTSDWYDGPRYTFGLGRFMFFVGSF